MAIAIHRQSILLALLVAFCVGCWSERDSSSMSHSTWRGDGLAFDYPAELKLQPFSMASSQATGCLCHEVSADGVAWPQIAEVDLAPASSEVSGIQVRTLDTSAEESSITRAGDLVLAEEVAKEFATRLAIPVGDGEAGYIVSRTVVAGFYAAHFSASSFRTSEGVTVEREDWILFDADLKRLHTVTCQFEAEEADLIRQACDVVISSLQVRDLG